MEDYSKPMKQSLVATKFFGFDPDTFCIEIYSVGYNEYLKAVSTLKEVLQQEFPEKQEDIEERCSRILETHFLQLDDWYCKFVEYCKKNIFVVHDRTPVYNPQLEEVEDNRQAPDKALSLSHCFMATEYLNSQLQGKLRELESEIKKRKELLADIVKTEETLELARKAKDLEQELDSVCGVELPDQPPSESL